MQGASPLASPALDRLRHLQNLPSRCPAGGGLPRRHWLDLPIRHSTGVCLRHRQFGAKPIETPFFGQCRQPRRGGTGGDGTIRRKRRRRLRWSSPPGQVEPVPAGASQPQTPGAGIASAAGGYRPRHPGIRPFAARTAPAMQVPGGGLAFLAAVLPCRCGTRRGGLPFLPPAAPCLYLLSCPHPPNPLPDGKGEPKVISCKGLRPLHPRAEPSAAREKRGEPCTRREARRMLKNQK